MTANIFSSTVHESRASLDGKSSGKLAYKLAAISCSLHMTQSLLISSFSRMFWIDSMGVTLVAVVGRA